MRLPGFTAETSAGPASQSYGYGTAQGEAGSFVTAAAFGVGLPVMRCCRWAPAFGRFVCTSRRHFAWESCQCRSGMFGPIITCRDNGATQQL